MKLEKIKNIDLRKFWKREASDFTTWLAQEENLSMLSEEINVELQLIQTEASVGNFKVDIYAKEETTGKNVIIENQLESTDHDHLGKLITYASGLDAEIIIWIVKDVRDEHKKAIDWLNENTDEKLNFFAIKMELWQIENSPYAPKFQIISQPNNWAKIAKRTTAQTELTDRQLLLLDFWRKFKEYADSNNSILKLKTPAPNYWNNIFIGNSVRIQLTIRRLNQINCDIYIPKSKELLDKLEEQKASIEKELNMKLEWSPADNTDNQLRSKIRSRIRKSTKANINNTEKWDEYIQWLENTASKFQKVFPKYINKLVKD